MIYTIAGGITFILIGVQALGVFAVSGVLLGICALVAGIALIAGK